MFCIFARALFASFDEFLQSGRSSIRRQMVLSTLLLFAFPVFCLSQTKRLVVVQYDGLSYEALDRFARERDPRTGKSLLPWVDHIFYQRGTRLANFYVRGMSLSAPSWSTIGTGQHLQIKGNVEFDRYTLQTYDYLNFVPFYVKATIGARVDMPGAEVLDSIGIPLLTDAYPRNERHVTFSLFQRGARYVLFQKALENRVKRGPKELFEEWTMGLDLKSSVPQQLTREVVEGAGNPNLRYLELSLTAFDHVAHHNNDRESHLYVLKQFDSILGEVWMAIQKSPVANETALIVVSDHGTNSVEGIYSQGYNLVHLLGSAAGGGHHVVTKRRLLADYALKGINPFAQIITTTTRDSHYLKGQSSEYPTAMLDFDGNERASIHLRDSDLNLLQILFQQLQRNELTISMRKALADQVFLTLEARRPQWQRNLDEVKEELGALHRSIERQRQLCEAQPKKFTPEESAAGKPADGRRVCAQHARWLAQEKNYGEYARTLGNLLALRKETFNPTKLIVSDVIAPRMMGDRNSVYQLQNYIVGIAPAGLILNSDGSLDTAKSFVRVDYLSLLHDITVRNNSQPSVGNRPVDMIALRLPSELVSPLLRDGEINTDVVWIYDGPEKQALILSRADHLGRLSFRYVPIRHLRQDNAGRILFQPAEWSAGLPLEILEDPNFAVPVESRIAWLNEWHTELDWFHAVHRTRYSNGLIGLHEELARHPFGRLRADEEGVSPDEHLMRRLLRRQRQNVETDLLVVANDHWNFDVRGFNPGGNHGSFFRISTHATFMLAGGDHTGIPRGVVVEEPYDNLSFVPTLLALTGNLRDDSNPIQVLWDKGFRRFPGRPVTEVLAKPANQKIAGTGATASP